MAKNGKTGSILILFDVKLWDSYGLAENFMQKNEHAIMFDKFYRFLMTHLSTDYFCTFYFIYEALLETLTNCWQSSNNSALSSHKVILGKSTICEFFVRVFR